MLVVRIEDVPGRVDLDVRRRNAALDDAMHVQPLPSSTDRIESIADDLDGHAEIDQGTEQHVPRRATRAVDVQVMAAWIAHRRTARRATFTAATAAPTPLSMLTTEMPGA